MLPYCRLTDAFMDGTDISLCAQDILFAGASFLCVLPLTFFFIMQRRGYGWTHESTVQTKYQELVSEAGTKQEPLDALDMRARTGAAAVLESQRGCNPAAWGLSVGVAGCYAILLEADIMKQANGDAQAHHLRYLCE